MKKIIWYYLYAIQRMMGISCRLFLLTILGTQVLLAGTSSGQAAREIKINVHVENRLLADVLAIIEKKSGLGFVYNDKLVAKYSNISVTGESLSVAAVLSRIFKDTNLDYLEKDRLIIVTEKAAKAAPQDIYVGTKDFQQITVKGKVTDDKGEPLIGVSVKVKNGHTGTSTGVDGQYSLTIDDEAAILLFSYVGYQDQELPVSGKTAINVVMKLTVANLQEAVVIGYGTQRRADVTSAVATVKADNFVKGPVLDAGQLLQGKVAGLTIASPSGNPTDGTQILLRGNTTLYGANANPLVIIDGIPGDLKTVAPEDIASMDVLKDGSSAAIYGVRGSNGVIIITTKRAKGSFTNNVDYSGYATTQVISKKLDMLTAQDYRDQIKAGTRLAAWDAGSNTDWLKEATRTPLTQVHNLTIRGGNDKTNYLVSANYRALQGIFRKSDNNTFTGRIDVNHSMFDDKLKLNIGILNQTNNYTRNNNGDNSFNGWIYRQTVIRNPTEPVRNANGDFYEQTGNFDYENPLALLYESDGEAKNVNSRMNATLTYRPINNLKLSALFSYARFNANKGYSESKKHISTIKSGLNGFASVSADLSIDRLTEWTAEYSRSFRKHQVVLLGGYGYQENTSSGMYSDNQDFPTDVFGYNNLGLGEGIKNKLANMSSNKTETNLISFFGRLNYSYDDKYLLMASLRREGASQLYGAKSPWGNFWAVSGGWRISNESFMKGQDLFDDLKLRAGYGITGNPPQDGFLSQPLITYGDYVYTNGKWTRILVPATNGNPFIRWEEKGEANIGLDFSLMKGRVSGSIDVYNRRISGLLYNYAVPSPPNLYPSTTANVGKMENKGIEIMLNFVPVKSKDFVWNTSVNFSTNSNKLISLSNELYQTTTPYFTTGGAGVPIQTFTNIVTIGKGIGDFYGYKVIDIDDNGKWIYEGRDGKAVKYDDFAHSFEDKKVIGNGLPKYYAGWNNNFSYGDFDLGITMRGAFGYQIINSQRMYMENPAIQNYNILKSAYDPVFGKTALKVNALEFNSYYVENGDFWKVDNITLGYTFKHIKSKSIKGARVYASSLNTFIITKYKGLDPEVNRMGLSPGMDDRDKYPTTRSFTVGVNLNF
ncbi:TonB-dependent receptor [Chitinophaga sp. 22321]|uniref:TonB-dependent receptor n=1 Tax=Chitinophaga hostae TaxID=2831022 RepID=A0ABS5J740_9BACT|nr:TonB-dependent receptor [Chitinophaga hostae]MBS0031004.1 TonB-dependent receptor [Chitinophaga hostae]